MNPDFGVTVCSISYKRNMDIFIRVKLPYSSLVSVFDLRFDIAEN